MKYTSIQIQSIPNSLKLISIKHTRISDAWIYSFRFTKNFVDYERVHAMQAELDLVIQRGVEAVVNAAEGSEMDGMSRNARLEAETRAAAARNRARRRESAAAAVAALRVEEISKALSKKGVSVHKSAAATSNAQSSETRAKSGSLVEKLITSGAISRDQLNDLQQELSRELSVPKNRRSDSLSHKTKSKKSKK